MNNDYSFSTASIEIIVALAAAFIAGALLCYLLRLLGLCCHRPKVETESKTRQVHMDVNQTSSGETADFRADFPVPTPPVVERAPAIEPQPPSAPAVTLAAEATPTNRLSVEGGAYEADINTLLRRGSPDTGTIPLPESTASSSSFADRACESLGASVGSIATPEVTHSDNNLIMPDDDHIDDLKRLEGIGPRIETLLNRYNIKSYARLATMDRDRLRDILELGGKEFKMHEPKSWPYQAELAAKENWDRLREYQEFLLEGRSS